MENLNQYLVLLYDFVPNLGQFISTDKSLKIASQLEVDSNATTSLYSDATKLKKNLDKKDHKKSKNNKKVSHL